MKKTMLITSLLIFGTFAASAKAGATAAPARVKAATHLCCTRNGVPDCSYNEKENARKIASYEKRCQYEKHVRKMMSGPACDKALESLMLSLDMDCSRAGKRVAAKKKNAQYSRHEKSLTSRR